MFIGHYIASFVAKAITPQVPLWLLLGAAQLVDIVWGIFILTGVEHASLDPRLASNPLVLHDMPYTHSLVATLAWSVIAFLMAWKAIRLAAREALAVAAVVASHWFLDLIVHRPDLPLLTGAPKFGFGLWNFPQLAYGLEVSLRGWHDQDQSQYADRARYRLAILERAEERVEGVSQRGLANNIFLIRFKRQRPLRWGSLSLYPSYVCPWKRQCDGSSTPSDAF